MTSDQARQQAERIFKKEERARDGSAAMIEYQADAIATREKSRAPEGASVSQGSPGAISNSALRSKDPPHVCKPIRLSPSSIVALPNGALPRPWVWGSLDRPSLWTMLSDFLLSAKRDGKASPMAVVAGNNFQLAANLLYEPKDEFHPEALAFGNLKSSGQSWPVVQH